MGEDKKGAANQRSIESGDEYEISSGNNDQWTCGVVGFLSGGNVNDIEAAPEWGGSWMYGDGGSGL